MKNKHYKTRKENEKLRKEIRKQIEELDENETYEQMKERNSQDMSEEEFIIMMEVSREIRIETFLKEDFNIEKETLDKVRKEIVKLNPKSKEFHLISYLYKKHKGMYKVDTLLNEYHDDTLREGMLHGMKYGEKFVIEDLQNKKYTLDDIKKMTDEEILEYCEEIRDKI